MSSCSIHTCTHTAKWPEPRKNGTEETRSLRKRQGESQAGGALVSGITVLKSLRVQTEAGTQRKPEQGSREGGEGKNGCVVYVDPFRRDLSFQGSTVTHLSIVNSVKLCDQATGCKWARDGNGQK